MGLWNTIADLVFSRVCEGCGAPVRSGEPGSICWDCLSRVPPVQLPFCDRCGDPVSGSITGSFECSWCRKTRPAFDWARSAVRYDGPVRATLRDFKYHTGFWVLPDLLRWMDALWNTCPPSIHNTDFILPVPLHPRRARERGYNQSAVLASRFARRKGLPFRPHTLLRIRSTNTQTHLTATARAHNVHGVFAVPFPRRVRGAHILLMDDVMTTGATVHECARTLKAAGAATVMVMTVARG